MKNYPLALIIAIIDGLDMTSSGTESRDFDFGPRLPYNLSTFRSTMKPTYYEIPTEIRNQNDSISIFCNLITEIELVPKTTISCVSEISQRRS